MTAVKKPYEKPSLSVISEDDPRFEKILGVLEDFRNNGTSLSEKEILQEKKKSSSMKSLQVNQRHSY